MATVVSTNVDENPYQSSRPRPTANSADRGRPEAMLMP